MEEITSHRTEEFRLMNKYQVYLTTQETIYIEADDFVAYYEHGFVRFVKDNENIAIFVLSNICGFEKVDKFDDEED